MRHLRLLFIFSAPLLLAATSTALAQYGYPGGYGGYGWGGWGGGTVAGGVGMEAAGLGNMAAGVGSYNVQTAQARNMNLNTAIEWNQYLYGETAYARQIRDIQNKRLVKDLNTSYKQTEDRLRNHPSQDDIYSGAALNIALHELSDPSYSQKTWQIASGIKISGKMIANIPFHDAIGGVTGSIDRITHAEPKGLLATETFAPDVAAYRKVCEEINKQVDEKGDVKSETVKQFRDVIQAAITKLQGLKNVDDLKQNDALRHLKTLLGLSYVLDGPSIDVFLAGVGDMKEITLDRLFSFMRAFNLEFGSITNPNQKQVYDELYPLLVQVRNQMFGDGTGTLPSTTPPPNPQAAYNFYAGMHPNDLHPGMDRSIPAPPAPK